jgi:hypothetical protein
MVFKHSGTCSLFSYEDFRPNHQSSPFSLVCQPLAMTTQAFISRTPRDLPAQAG